MKPRQKRLALDVELGGFAPGARLDLVARVYPASSASASGAAAVPEREFTAQATATAPDAQASPGASAVLRDLAWAYLELGRLDDAKAAIDACERSQPHGTIRDDVALRRVVLAAKAGKADEARRVATEVLRDFSWKDRAWRDRIRKAAGLPDEPSAAEAAPSEDGGGD